MKTVTLTEFNQNPSRVTRLADTDEVIVLRRGVAAYRLERIRRQSGDRVNALVEAGLLSAARRGDGPRRRPLRTASAEADPGLILEADRGRLGG